MVKRNQEFRLNKAVDSRGRWYLDRPNAVDFHDILVTMDLALNKMRTTI